MASGLEADKADRDQAFMARMEEAARLAGNATRLSEKTGISRRAIGEYLSGNAEPTRPRLVAIGDATGLAVEWLATGRGVKFVHELQAPAAPDALEVARRQLVTFEVAAWLVEKGRKVDREKFGRLVDAVESILRRNKPNLSYGEIGSEARATIADVAPVL